MDAAFFKQAVREICMGNTDAINFCESYSEMICVLDDIIDKDKVWSTEKVVTTFSVFATNLLLNNFVKQNATMLVPPILSGCSDFVLSEELCESSLDSDLATANVLKSGWNTMLFVVAGIIGGQGHAIAMAKKYRVFNSPAEEFKKQPSHIETTSIGDYYDKTTAAYVETIGDHLQITAWDKDRAVSDEIQFNRMGVKDGENILDAGCGVLGPALGLIRLYPNAKVTGVTLSREQFLMGQKRITPDIEDRLRVFNMDYTNTGFDANQFDGIMFMESYCYVQSHKQIVDECLRMLKPGGWVYIIGWFLPDRDLSTKDWIEVRAHEAEWHDKVKTVDEVSKAFEEGGFETNFARNVGGLLEYEPLVKGNVKANGEPSDLFKFHDTTTWIDLMKMSELRFTKR